MRGPRGMWLAPLLACGGGGVYEVGWTVAGVAPAPDRPEVCAAAGLDAVQVIAAAAGDGAVGSEKIFPCRDGRGADGVDPGTWVLFVYGLGPTGRPLVGALTIADVVVKDDTTTDAGAIDLPRPPECADGLDNDADGRVDASDPGCALDPPAEAADAP